MSKKHPKKGLISKSVAEHKTNPKKYINQNPSIMEGWNVDGNSAKIFLSFRFLQHNYQCFSDWNKSEMKTFWSFSDKIHEYSWDQLYKSSGKTEKTGLGYTVIPSRNYPDSEFKSKLDPEITLFELRLDNSKRVHGFRHKSVFYICWLDKNHDICS